MDIFVPSAPRGMRRTSAGLLVPDGERPRAPHARGVLQTRSLYSRGVAAGGGGGGGEPSSGLYFNSYETTGPNDVRTEDFNDARWYEQDADHTDWQNDPDSKGWGGTIFANPITPPNAVVNLAALGLKPLFGTSDYAGTTGLIDGENQRNNAWANLFGADSGGYEEIFIRWYTFFCPANYFGAGNPSGNYLFGGQKGITVNRFGDDGGINICGGLGYNVGSGGSDPNGTPSATNNRAPGGGGIIHQNQGNNIDHVAGNWYFNEIRIKLNSVGSTNGIYQFWSVSGGLTGNFSGLSPVLRTSRSDIDWGRTAGFGPLIGNVWFENWSNAIDSPSVGIQLYRNIRIAKAGGPVGFTTA